MDRKGQTSLEVMITAVVLLGMMLATTVTMVQRNVETERFGEIQQDLIKCQAISATISNFNSNQAYSQSILRGLEKAVHIEKGSIVTGTISCRYIGLAQKDDDGNPVTEVFTKDSTGFDLGQGERYDVKKLPQGVTFYKITIVE